MSKIDRLKEELGWLNVVFAVFVAVDVSLIGWLAQNYGSASNILLACSIIAIALITAIVIWVNRAAMKRFPELEDE